MAQELERISSSNCREEKIRPMIPIWISSVALSFSCEAVMPCEAKKYLDDYEGDDVYRHRTAQIRNSSRKELDVVSSIELLSNPIPIQWTTHSQEAMGYSS